MAQHICEAQHEQRIEVRPTFDRQITNSALRALDVLAFFDDIQRPSSVGEIARALRIPQSSTSLLLRTLVMAGYLDHDPFQRTYVPSERTALLGHWVNPRLVREGAIMKVMDRLREETDSAVFLAMRNGLNAQYIHVVQSPVAQLSHLVPGTVRPLVFSCVGYALITDWSNHKIMAAAVRFNAESHGDIISPHAVVQSVEMARVKGFSVSRNLHTKGGLAVAAPIAGHAENALLALGIGTVGEGSNQCSDRLGETLVAAIAGLANP